jgi:proline racemase
MRHEARLSSAVPHSTAFLPPAFIAMLPPMHEASAEVGSTANTSRRARPRRPRAGHDAGLARWWAPGSVDAGQRMRSTSLIASSFSVLITALFQVSGTAPPV